MRQRREKYFRGFTPLESVTPRSRLFFGHRKTLTGFTLIELLVAMSLFALLMVGVSQIFAKASSGYRDTRAIQKDLETAQFALDTLAKELRTSTVVAFTGTNSSYVKFFDYSQNRCIQYRINGTVFQVAKMVVGNLDACRATTLSDFVALTNGSVSGFFRVTPSDPGPPLAVGRVTVSLQISEGANHTARVQTSASLRDYGYIGLVR